MVKPWVRRDAPRELVFPGHQNLPLCVLRLAVNWRRVGWFLPEVSVEEAQQTSGHLQTLESRLTTGWAWSLTRCACVHTQTLYHTYPVLYCLRIALQWLSLPSNMRHCGSAVSTSIAPFGAIPQEALTLELSATEKVTRWPRLGTVTKPHLFSLITLELKSRGPRGKKDIIVIMLL